MKKLLFFICAVVMTTLAVNAQSVQVLRNGKTIAEFYDRDDWEFVFSNKTNVLDGHEFVRIGGKKWATKNVGATTVAGSYETCTGDFYQWGSVSTLYDSKSWNGSTWTFTWKSDKGSGYVDANKEYTENANLPAANDVATKLWGDGWRMPTKDDFQELYDACHDGSLKLGGTTLTAAKGIYLCDNYDGVKGVLFCDGTNKVFFPAAGRVADKSFNDGGSFGLYWSSSLDTGNTSNAYRLFFNFTLSNVSPQNPINRYYGFSVRPVSD